MAVSSDGTKAGYSFQRWEGQADFTAGVKLTLALPPSVNCNFL
jgi:hypothetical protein